MYYNLSENSFLLFQLKFNFFKKLQMHHQKNNFVNMDIIKLLEMMKISFFELNIKLKFSQNSKLSH